jgi:hypothetical protein
MLSTGCVHAEPALPARRPAFPQATGLGRARPHNWGISCAQTAIIPTNSVIDASAAASSTKVFNIPRLPGLEHMRNHVPFLFSGVKRRSWVGLRNELEMKRLVNGARPDRKSAAGIAANAGAACGPAGVWGACRLLLFAKNRRLHRLGFPIEEIIEAGPSMDLGLANPAFETAGMLVRMLLSCRVVIHPATGAGEVFGRPYAACHPTNMPRRPCVFQCGYQPQSN